MLFRGTKAERNALIAALGCRASVLGRRIERMGAEGNDESAHRHEAELALVQEMRAALKGWLAQDTREPCQTAEGVSQ